MDLRTKQADVRRLFLEALDVPAGQRSAFLDNAGVSAETKADVRALLEYDSTAEGFFERVVAVEGPATLAAGEIFGAYRTLRLVARGGMGAVFEAERTDGELRQIVAIKVVEHGWLNPRAIERFRQERQLLANLVHPNIARLLDGGTRPDGLPYLVMEYVEGLRLDEYCARHALPLEQRLRLFLPLCDAVQYAHQKLIIHRDLKPSNVLVTAVGEAKLLDFGIGKVLEQNTAGVTQTLVLTPAYASPEQVRGEEATTATDVYGLGAVLYQLLTEHPPHHVENLSPAELQRAVCDTGPKRPSEYRPELAGDIENILLKSLHPEAHRRYGSARELADDIEHFLEHRPVRATPDRWWYRTRRFVERHAFASVAAAVAIVTGIAGTGISLYEAKRAGQRFAQVRKLAGRSLFDFEEAIRDVPGTLDARRLVAGTAREYLQNLAADARGDTGLARELAESHYRLSRVETALPQVEAALGDLNRALALWRGTHDDCCGPAPQRRLYIMALVDLANLQRDARKVEDAVTAKDEAVRRARAWVREAPDDPVAARTLVEALLMEAHISSALGHETQQRALLTEALDRAAKIPRVGLDEDSFAFSEAQAANGLARLCSSLHDSPCEIRGASRAREILDRLIARQPNNARMRNLRVRATANWAMALRRMAEKDESVRPQSLQRAREAYELAATDAHRDPRDTDAGDLAVVMAGRWATQLHIARRNAEALAVWQSASQEIDRLLALDPTHMRFLYLRMNNRAAIGSLLVDVGRCQEADPVLIDAARQADELLVKTPRDEFLQETKIDILVNQSLAAENLGRRELAIGKCQAALNVAQEMIRRDPALAQTLGNIDDLHRQARKLHLADPTLVATKVHRAS